MISFIPTPHGAGVRLWGTQMELHDLYETVEKFWNPLEEASDTNEYDRDIILASFCYDIRHGFMGNKCKLLHVLDMSCACFEVVME